MKIFKKSEMKALSLFSGGLDSILATKLIQKQGIRVEGIYLVSSFLNFNMEKVKTIARNLNIYLHITDITEKLLTILKFPLYGFGKGANPCIDCHILMVKEAGLLMKKIGASFLISGEVLGERPMSQNRWALNIISEKSGWGEYLLRPLTAKNLSPTLPEKKGWVKREDLLDIKGRSRNIQLKLAKEMGLNDFPTPAGGCLLTDPIFSQRIKNLLKRGRLNSREVEFLKLGRHFYIGNNTKVIVGRNQKENQKIFELATPGDICLQVIDFPGPLTLLRGEKERKILQKAASITIRYSDAPPFEKTKVEYYEIPQGRKNYLIATSIKDEELEKMREIK
ncbi:tRNA 4-thiouridine(8) synthase ThiI [Candidatus Aerophobetes bacterium]|nr:tRNA 4-thiouridine(8) synthase ThiI [Candidatus Aerophobetes bacterium]